MGDQGTLVLVNGTPYTWQLVGVHSYQLSKWSFPRTVSPFAAVAVNVQRSDAPFRDRTQDGGEATFGIVGTSSSNPLSFVVQARADNGLPFRLQVQLTSVATQGNPIGSLVSLGWVVDGQINFVLAGKYNNTGTGFVCNNTPVAWMHASLASIGSRPLRQICMPGSHDSGMFVRNKSTIGVFDCNALTQRVGFGEQLECGARYFDLRPAVSSGQYVCGHYSSVNGTLLGANGQTFDNIIQDLNKFTAQNAELVILNLSHDLNADKGGAGIPFNQDDWDKFLVYLQSSIRSLYIAPGGVNTDLAAQPLNAFIGSGRAAVICMFAPADGGHVSLSSQFAGKGFYRYTQLNAYDRYSNTNDLAAMTSDQLSKMRATRQTPDSTFFLCSWTLTQNAVQASTCFLGTASSILELGAKANVSLFNVLWPSCTSACYPNVLFIDALDSKVYTALAMAVNSLLGASKMSPAATLSVENGSHQQAEQPSVTGDSHTHNASVVVHEAAATVEHRVSTVFGAFSDRVEVAVTKTIKQVDVRRAHIADLRATKDAKQQP
ncbi:PLC-like phosphodiesterase [Auriculariales sp. MPI-PUGE-AT-0066]|nr:PLC-like phosphodiesterase [Auriculariales sp. MPI-PUGE-AT-0066]